MGRSEPARWLATPPQIIVNEGRFGASLFQLDLAFVTGHLSLTVSDITVLLNAAQKGAPEAAEELLPLVYDELRRLAAWRLANERPGRTLQATALVHEAYQSSELVERIA